MKLNRAPPPEPKRPPPPPAWVDKKVAPVIPELLLTEENSGRVVPLFVPVLVGSAGAAKAKVLGDGGGVCPMTGAEAPVSGRLVDPKTNPPPLAAANWRGTELLGGGVAIGTSGAAALVLPLLPAFSILRLRSFSVAVFVKVPTVVSTLSRCIALLADITLRSD